MKQNINIQIVNKPLSIDQCYDFIVDQSCGGICLFIGTVRNHNKGAEVSHLNFESYTSMALKEMELIASECIEKFQAKKVAIHHKEGMANISDIAVIIGVSCIHRKQAFEACEYAIDQLKSRVTIWKKEHLSDGSYWINARP